MAKMLPDVVDVQAPEAKDKATAPKAAVKNHKKRQLTDCLKLLFRDNCWAKARVSKCKPNFETFSTTMALMAAFIAMKEPADHPKLLEAAAESWAHMNEDEESVARKVMWQSSPVLPSIRIDDLAHQLWLGDSEDYPPSGRRFPLWPRQTPLRLVVQCDNTAAQSKKNRFFIAFSLPVFS